MEREKKGLGKSGHLGWTFPTTQFPTRTCLTGLREMGVGAVQSPRDWKAENREGNCERHKRL